MADRIEKVSIIISKGSLDGVYPGLIMANGARAEGIDGPGDHPVARLDAESKERVAELVAPLLVLPVGEAFAAIDDGFLVRVELRGATQEIVQEQGDFHGWPPGLW